MNGHLADRDGQGLDGGGTGDEPLTVIGAGEESNSRQSIVGDFPVRSTTSPSTTAPLELPTSMSSVSSSPPHGQDHGFGGFEFNRDAIAGLDLFSELAWTP